MDGAGDDNGEDEEDSEWDDGVDLEEGRHHCCGCCLERYVGCKEQKSLQAVRLSEWNLLVFVVIIAIEVCIEVPICACPCHSQYTSKDAGNLHDESKRVFRGAGLQDDVGHCKV